ncbi:MAG: transposase [Imperialibacter sp.]|uniref:ISAon1 family transposase n=1 Tax=Imperialibacter sp. TaxID=2038411 RepID=UPI0032F03EC0
MEEQYATHLSDYTSWDQLDHAEDYVVFLENIGEYLTIDETSLSQGELYTIVTNKAAKGNKGCLVAIIKGTDSERVKSILIRKIPLEKRRLVKEVTLDMAASMEQIVTKTFTKATLVTDRFHVQKLAYDAVQQMRIEYRWEAIEQENKEIELSREMGKSFVPNKLENGDTPKQLLARSRYLLFKRKELWSPSQIHRAEILFHLYPHLEQAYNLAQKLGRVYQKVKDKGVAFTKLAQWYDQVEKAGFKSFNTVSRTIQNHYLTILNYFERRSTNAAAESFNAKIKAFRSQFRGVRNVSFFLYRLSKIYA